MKKRLTFYMPLTHFQINYPDQSLSNNIFILILPSLGVIFQLIGMNNRKQNPLTPPIKAGFICF